MILELAFCVLGALRMLGVVVHHVRVAVEAEWNGIVQRVVTGPRLRGDVVYLYF